MVLLTRWNSAFYLTAEELGLVELHMEMEVGASVVVVTGCVPTIKNIFSNFKWCFKQLSTIISIILQYFVYS